MCELFMLAVFAKQRFSLVMKVSLQGLCRQRRPGSDCASAQSDQGLCCLLTNIGYYVIYRCAASLTDLALYCSHISHNAATPNTFSHGMAYLCYCVNEQLFFHL